MKNILIIFPNHLYSFDLMKNIYKTFDHVVLIQEPLFFLRPQSQTRMCKVRCAFTYASTCAWYSTYKPKYKALIEFVQFHEVPKWLQQQATKLQKDTVKWSCLDPFDYDVVDKYKKIFHSLQVIEPKHAFVFDVETLDKTFKHGIHSNAEFFKKAKDILGLAKQFPVSTDTANRQPFTQDVKKRIPKPHKYQSAKIYQDAIKYVEKHFSNHPGTCELDALQILPITHIDAQKHLDRFLNQRFKNFGEFEDAVSKDPKHIVGFHSHISFLLNTGLLTPKDVIQRSLAFAKKVPHNSLEGFIRQVLGWREYMRYLYHVHGREWKKKYIKSKGTHDSVSEEWYKGTTGLLPIDSEIQKALKYGWSHHIVRLMFFLNPLKMMGYSAFAIYKWFMEVVSLDAYDWVMVTNIVTMGYFVKGFTHKPYLSGSNYLLRMSDYKADDEWPKVMDALFYSSIQQEPAYKRNLYAWTLMDKAKKSEMVKLAARYR